jgi:cytoskeleton protein RodZ
MKASVGDTRWDDGDVVFSPEERSHTVGGTLRAQRERLGWTLPAISNHLRIRQPFLEAIEEGRIEDLPGRAYAIGFIRTYAQSLGLDPAEIAQRFRAEAGESARRTELEFPAPVPERGVPALAVALVGVVIAIGAYATWYRMSGNEGPSGETVQPLPERLAALVPEHSSAEPPITPPQGAASPPTTAPLQATSAQTEPRAVPADPASAAAAIPPPAALAPVAGSAVPASGSATPRGRATPPGSTAPGTQTAALEPAPVPAQNPRPAPASSPAAGSAAPSDQGHVELRATSDAWMRVRERGGHEYLDRVLKAGETWDVPDKPNLLLSTGNAAGTVVLVDGVAMPSLGGSGVVRHDLPLDPDALRARLAAAGQPVVKPFVSPHNQ